MLYELEIDGVVRETSDNFAFLQNYARNNFKEYEIYTYIMSKFVNRKALTEIELADLRSDYAEIGQVATAKKYNISKGTAYNYCRK